MEDKTTGESAIMNWITRLTSKITSGKIVPMHYGEDVPAAIADAVRSARAVWIVELPDSTFDIAGLFDSCEARKGESPSPTDIRQRIMFPCPIHNAMASQAEADVIRRSKLARAWGLEVKWVDHATLQSMIIINPPTEHDHNLGDGLAIIDLSLSNLTARVKFEITQRNQNKIFSDLVNSFSRTWGTAHYPTYKKTQHSRIKNALTGIFVA